MSHEFSIIIPVLNEAPCLPRLVDEISQVFSGRSYELIIIDDGSTDETLATLIELKDNYPALRVVGLPSHGGKSRALLAGAEAAKGHLLGLMDGDGQDDPSDLLRLYRVYVAANAPQDIGMVMGERTHRSESPLRQTLSGVSNKLRRWRLRDDARDSACGMKVIPRDLYLSLPYFDTMHRFMPALVKAVRRRVGFVPIDQRDRIAGQSKYGTWNRLMVGLSDLNGVAWLTKRNREAARGKEY